MTASYHIAILFTGAKAIQYLGTFSIITYQAKIMLVQSFCSVSRVRRDCINKFAAVGDKIADIKWSSYHWIKASDTVMKLTFFFFRFQRFQLSLSGHTLWYEHHHFGSFFREAQLHKHAWTCFFVFMSHACHVTVIIIRYFSDVLELWVVTINFQ